MKKSGIENQKISRKIKMWVDHLHPLVGERQSGRRAPVLPGSCPVFGVPTPRERGKRAHSGPVFGIGLSRTGTKSLTVALNRLGYHVVHQPQALLHLLSRVRSDDGVAVSPKLQDLLASFQFYDGKCEGLLLFSPFSQSLILTH